MRQIHQLVTAPDDAGEPTSAQPAKRPPALPQAALPQAVDRQTADPQTVPRAGRPADATLDELVAIGRAAASEHGRATRAVVQQAIRDKGLKVGGQRLTQAMGVLRAELGTERSDD